jgi:hypothetical protein
MKKDSTKHSAKNDNMLVMYSFLYGPNENEIKPFISNDNPAESFANILQAKMMGKITAYGGMLQIKNESEVDSLDALAVEIITKIGGEDWWLQTGTIKDTQEHLTKYFGEPTKFYTKSNKQYDL